MSASGRVNMMKPLITTLRLLVLMPVTLCSMLTVPWLCSSSTSEYSTLGTKHIC